MEEFDFRGHQCKYLKTTGEYFELDEKYDFIFVCSSIVCFETEIKICKKLLKNSKLFLCGTVGTFLTHLIPDEITLISGNYEFLPEQLDNSKSNLYNLKNEKFINVLKGNPDNLNIINWKSKNLPKTKNYLLGNSRYFFPFISTRGCPYSCREYCTYPTTQGRKIILESNETVSNKLFKISKKFPKSHIVFRDPVFSINIKYTKNLLKKIGDLRLDLSFSAELHLKNIDDELIELFKYANFTGLKFGIESAHKNVRDHVNRFSIDNDEQVKIIKKLNKNKIKTVGMFILAQPNDTTESCLSTINYACSLNLNIAQFSIFTPYPGTPYYEKGNFVKNFRKFEECNQYNLTYDHPTISKKEARFLLEKAYKKFIFSKFKYFFTAQNLFQK